MKDCLVFVIGTTFLVSVLVILMASAMHKFGWTAEQVVLVAGWVFGVSGLLFIGLLIGSGFEL